MMTHATLFRVRSTLAPLTFAVMCALVNGAVAKPLTCDNSLVLRTTAELMVKQQFYIDSSEAADAFVIDPDTVTIDRLDEKTGNLVCSGDYDIKAEKLMEMTDSRFVIFGAMFLAIKQSVPRPRVLYAVKPTRNSYYVNIIDINLNKK